MPFHTEVVGSSTEPLTHDVDARWVMAYSASLNDLNSRYMDTAAHRVIAHPVFPVCLEWPVILNTRKIAGAHSLTPSEAARGVHAGHDLHIFRPIRAGDRLTTTATMIGAEAIKPGAAYTMRLDTVDATNGDLIARTYQLGIYRDVEVQGAARESERAPALPGLTNPAGYETAEIFVPEGSAHTYTECARIWNPIHTDREVALGAGLPDIILHGTATLALAVSRIVDRYADGEAERVVRLGGRFSAMVLMPSTITLQSRRDGDVVSCQVMNADGALAISHGFVVLE